MKSAIKKRSARNWKEGKPMRKKALACNSKIKERLMPEKHFIFMARRRDSLLTMILITRKNRWKHPFSWWKPKAKKHSGQQVCLHMEVFLVIFMSVSDLIWENVKGSSKCKLASKQVGRILKSMSPLQDSSQVKTRYKIEKWLLTKRLEI